MLANCLELLNALDKLTAEKFENMPILPKL